MLSPELKLHVHALLTWNEHTGSEYLRFTADLCNEFVNILMILTLTKSKSMKFLYTFKIHKMLTFRTAFSINELVFFSIILFKYRQTPSYAKSWA